MAATDLGVNDPNSTVGQPAGTSGVLSEFAGEYVSDMLGKTRALADKPYNAYGGPLTAGASGLQNQAFGGYGALDPNQQTGIGSFGFGAGPGSFGFGSAAGQGYSPRFTAGSADMSGMQAGSFTGDTAQQYMNPYLQAALNPQIAEVRRQEAITQSQDAGRAAQAGAFGGSRSFIMDAERARNTGQQIADITGKGYASAFDTAQQQFNTEQNMRQRIAEVGLDQFNKEQAGLRGDETARRGQFNTEADRQATFDDTRRRQFNTETDRDMQFDEDRRNQFNEEERRRIAGGESDRRYGLDSLSAMNRAGDDQRRINQEGITADYLQYQQEQQYPYEQLKFMQSMMQGLPIEAQSQSFVDPSSYEQIAGGGSDLAKFIKLIMGGFSEGDE